MTRCFRIWVLVAGVLASCQGAVRNRRLGNLFGNSDSNKGNNGKIQPPAPMADTENTGTGNSDFGADTSTASSVTGTSPTTMSIVASITAIQGPHPPPATSLDCSLYSCNSAGIGQNGGCGMDNPPSAPRTCGYRDLTGSKMCYGVYCLTAEAGSDYCLCPPNTIGTQCSTHKPGSCTLATGLLPPTSYSAANKRYRQKQNPDMGNVYARHMAATGTDCIRLCQWAAPECQSVNYGTLSGVQVCELLSVTVTNGSVMRAWLTDSPGWTYTTVTGKLAAI